jgi:hypothetical protein
MRLHRPRGTAERGRDVNERSLSARGASNTLERPLLLDRVAGLERDGSALDLRGLGEVLGDDLLRLSASIEEVSEEAKQRRRGGKRT